MLFANTRANRPPARPRQLRNVTATRRVTWSKVGRRRRRFTGVAAAAIATADVGLTRANSFSFDCGLYDFRVRVVLVFYPPVTSFSYPFVPSRNPQSTVFFPLFSARFFIYLFFFCYPNCSSRRQT